MFISVCVITYKRPAGLQRLIEGLFRLSFERVEEPKIEVVVVDNDAEASAGAVCKQFEGGRWPVRYDVEPRQGISYARNRSVALASSDGDFVAILDDDEAPDMAWLENLLLVQQQWDADVVAGAVVPDFGKAHVPAWAERGRFFQQPRHKTGDKIHVAFTNNVLVRTALLKSIDPVFDDRFALTGGEDAHLFLRLHQQGRRLVWANEAIVYESVHPSRISPLWILRRGFHSRSLHSYIERELYPSAAVRLERFLKGSVLIGGGILALLPSPLLGRHAIVAALLTICNGAGTLFGLLGMRHREYARFAG